MSDLPPAGWYPDPTVPGQQRWWDGQRWSDHRAPGSPAATAAPAGSVPRLATFGQRLGASLLDGLVLSIPLFGAIAATFVVFAVIAGAALDGSSGAGSGVAFGGVAVFGIVMLAAMVLPVLYAVGFEGSPHGQTIGKWLVGIRVVDGPTAGRLGTSKAFVRVLVRTFASGAVFALGYLWMLWDEQGRTWHDLAADSRVVVATGRKPAIGELLRSWTLRG